VSDEPPCIICGSYCGQCGGKVGNVEELRADPKTGLLYRWKMERDAFGRWRPVRKEQVNVVNR
jgi:hypothetical protein